LYKSVCNSEKDKYYLPLKVSQNNGQPAFFNISQAIISGLLPTPPDPLHINTSSTSHLVVDAYTDTYAIGHVFPPRPTQYTRPISSQGKTT